MNLWIDGRQVEAVPGERLLDAVRRLGLDHPELSRRLWRRGLLGRPLL